ALRWGKPNEPLITTNDYWLLDQPAGGDTWDLERTSCSRYSRLWHLANRKPMDEPVADEELLYWLTDEEVRQVATSPPVLLPPAFARMRLFVPRWLAGAPSQSR